LWWSATSWAALLLISSARFEAFRARGNHRERNAASRLVDFQNPDFDDVADRNHFVRIANVTIRQLTDVNQSAVVQSDINKRTEVDNIEHGTGELHSLVEVFELEDTTFEDWLWQIFARIAARASQLRENISE
jgi:hypothetical protein